MPMMFLPTRWAGQPWGDEGAVHVSHVDVIVLPGTGWWGFFQDPPCLLFEHGADFVHLGDDFILFRLGCRKTDPAQMKTTRKKEPQDSLPFSFDSLPLFLCRQQGTKSLNRLFVDIVADPTLKHLKWFHRMHGSSHRSEYQRKTLALFFGEIGWERMGGISSITNILYDLEIYRFLEASRGSKGVAYGPSLSSRIFPAATGRPPRAFPSGPFEKPLQLLQDFPESLQHFLMWGFMTGSGIQKGGRGDSSQRGRFARKTGVEKASRSSGERPLSRRYRPRETVFRWVIP